MKNRFLLFLKRYWLCLLLSVIMSAGFLLSTIYAGTYKIGSGMLQFDLSILYLIYVVPIYSLIYGGLTYVKIKKVWGPQLFLYFTTVISLFYTNLVINKNIDAWKNILTISAYPIIFSLIGVGITALIYKAIKSIKKD